MLGAVTAAEEAERAGTAAGESLRLVLCAIEDALAEAWESAADGRPEVHTHRGSTLDVPADAVVSPANSYGWMRGGIDAVYARTFPSLEQHVRSAVLAYHGGELPATAGSKTAGRCAPSSRPSPCRASAPGWAACRPRCAPGR